MILNGLAYRMYSVCSHCHHCNNTEDNPKCNTSILARSLLGQQYLLWMRSVLQDVKKETRFCLVSLNFHYSIRQE